MADLDLFAPIARTDDPATSHHAAAKVQPKRGTDAWRVLCWYRAQGQGYTAKEYVAMTKHEGGWKRISDLLRLGLLAPTGEVRDGGRVLVVDSLE